MSRCSRHLLPPPPPPPPPPAPFAPPGPRREVVEKHKTRLCRFHEQGRCNKGSACTFAHSQADLRIGPATVQAMQTLQAFWMPYKTKQCFFWEKGKCQRGSMCTFAHCSGELPEAARHSEGSAGELSEEEQRPVKAAFDLFDTNGLGWLDYEDLKEAMQTLHHEPGEWEFHELFGNHAVRVRYEEFLKMMTHKIRGSVERRNDVSQARRSATGRAAEDETGRATPATDSRQAHRGGPRLVPPNDWSNVSAPPPLPWDDYEDEPWVVTDKLGIGSDDTVGSDDTDDRAFQPAAAVSSSDRRL